MLGDPERLEQVAPFRVSKATDVLPVDGPTWAESNLESYGSLVEPFATSVGAESPAAPLLSQMAPAIVGLQVGSLVGSLSTWVVAGFDAGLPPDRDGPMGLVVPNIDHLAVEDVDRREVHLWVVANEVAFRTISQLPWIGDHLSVARSSPPASAPASWSAVARCVRASRCRCRSRHWDCGAG